MKLSEAGSELEKLIKKAIQDCEVTHSEYQQIQDMAYKDGNIDQHEQKLLTELERLIANQTVKRVPG